MVQREGQGPSSSGFQHKANYTFKYGEQKYLQAQIQAKVTQYHYFNKLLSLFLKFQIRLIYQNQ